MPSQRALLALLCLVFVLLTGVFSTLVPLGEAPDEVSHFAYVRWLASHRTLPPPDPDEMVFGEVFQPPLYYALVAPVTAWQPDGPIPVENNPDYSLDDPNPVRSVRLQIQTEEMRWPWRGEALAWHLLRFASIPLGLITILATYALGRSLLPNDPWGGLLAAAFVAFLPQFTYLNSVVSNDPLIIMLSALLLALLARALGRPIGAWRPWLLAGVVGGLSIWTKNSGWVLAGTAGLAWLLTWQQPQRWQRAVALGGSWLLVAAPWLLWSLRRSGDIFGWGLLAQVTDAQSGPITLALFQEELVGLYRSFWLGVGGAAHNLLPSPIPLLLALPLLLGVVGLWQWARGEGGAAPRHGLLWLGAHLLLVLAAWMQWTTTVLGTGQGRLIFPALPAIAVLLAAGWLALWPSRRTAPTIILLLALFNLGVLATVVRPLYRGRPALPAPTQSVEAGWLVGDAMQLRRHEFLLHEQGVRAGTASELFVEWEALTRLPDLRMRLHLVDEAGTVVWRKEGTPSAGWDTSDVWPPGVPIAAWHRVIVPEEATPGWHRLLLSVADRDGRTLPITGPNGDPFGDQVAVGGLWVER